MANASTKIVWKLRRTLHRLGVDLVPYRHTRHPIARRLSLFTQHGVDLVVDVGANCGQYGQFLRRIGYRGRIISIEPLSTAFRELEAAAAEDPSWEVRRMALGDHAGTAVLNVAENSESSSLLPMLTAHLAAYPQSRYIGSEEVPLQTLAHVIEGLSPDCRPFVKVDAQGFERSVLAGAGAGIQRIRGVQLEMSLVPLYKGEALLPEIVTLMAEMGFVLMAVEPGASDPSTGQLLQLDGIFFRSADEAGGSSTE
jgi:FkbM family methyltransferase